jgi:hypothetical protein
MPLLQIDSFALKARFAMVFSYLLKTVTFNVALFIDVTKLGIEMIYKHKHSVQNVLTTIHLHDSVSAATALSLRLAEFAVISRCTECLLVATYTH